MTRFGTRILLLSVLCAAISMATWVLPKAPGQTPLSTSRVELSRDGVYDRADRSERRTPSPQPSITPSSSTPPASPSESPTESATPRTSTEPDERPPEHREARRPTEPPATPPRTTRPPAPPATPTTPASGNTALENQVVDLVNDIRVDAGCGTVRVDERLRAAARAHSADMARWEYMDHTGRDGSTPWERAERAGYPAAMSENIAMGYPTAQAVVDAWMNSPGHRANILNCSARAIGVGVASSSDGTRYWTQMFGRE